MRLLNKFIIPVTFFILNILLATVVSAESGGFAVEWEPFIVNDDLELNRPSKNILPKDIFVFEEMPGHFGYVEDLMHFDLKMKNDVSAENTKKSMFSKIKVSVSHANSFMMPGDEAYTASKDGKFSQAVKILPSFFQNPSQEKALETLKLIEPQVNFGFEF